ncbi:holo-ACP synthase [Malaciobacter molluscorum LMG 25693]|uniref:Holo-[acyl-carrier-protein] synthase n=1 Tax=Malaciobacter molluscorum LMG 25693 TaxID=870501 RepID=A0A2G1DHB0_9BACT|nr:MULTISPECIES: holo-ACP synthase [Arcobacteraceae]AXX93421.1 holo-(acyl-carrier-protein) synthase [Malaciobacter molluscorum LMG 25693]PHO17824.1 holo-ACP synthase [Malaciobacter molluscorum LMG 25693]RXJ95060.1 holo-ACP synthase [Malaciobacter molluscorum]RXJ98572.1 holo-ACP synthase [Arcobacter sp. CECT 8986]
MIGIDVTSIDRIKRMFDKFGIKAYQRFLSEDEIKLVKRAETAAGFWAAKEAASKAIGTGIGKDCGFHDIKISKDELGAPKLKYKKHIRKKFNIKKSHLSITHDANLAIAVVKNSKKKK